MKDIKGYEKQYAVTSCGKVWSYKSKKFLKSFEDKFGYEFVRISNDNVAKCKYVHRLVAETYLQRNGCKLEVNHKDENKRNNSVNNLEWITHKENINYGTRNERTSKKVMCVETGEIFNSLGEVKEKYGIGKGSILKCCSGKIQTAGKRHWKFV